MIKRLPSFILLAAVACLFGFVSSSTKKVDASVEPHYTIGTETTDVPFEIQSKNGSYNSKHPGIDIELLKAIAKKEHFTYSLKIMSFTAIVQAVQGGQVDGAITGLMINPDRKKVLDFSKPYIGASLSLATAPKSAIKNLSDMKGKVLAVKTGSTSEMYAESIAKKYGFTIRDCDTSNTAFNDVTSGNADAL